MNSLVDSILNSFAAKTSRRSPLSEEDAHDSKVEVLVDRNRSPSSSPKGSSTIDTRVLISAGNFGSQEAFAEFNASLSSTILRVEKLSSKAGKSGKEFDKLMDDVDEKITHLYAQYEGLLKLTLFDDDGYFLRVTDAEVCNWTKLVLSTEVNRI